MIPASNNYTLAMFSNPFGFSLQPLEAGPSITLAYQGVNAAQINLPLAAVTAGTSRGPTDMAPLELSFRDQTIMSLNDAQFQLFLATLADTTGATFQVFGSTSVVAKTQIGNPLITGIPFSVTTSLVGVDSFEGNATVSDVAVNDPTNAYIGINLVAGLYNPSNLTLFSDSLSLPTVYTTYNVVIGRATIPKLGLIPGLNLIDVLFEFIIPPGNSSQIQEVLQLYLQPKDFMTTRDNNSIPLQIKGSAEGGAFPTPPLTPYPVLAPALGGDGALPGVIADATLQGLATRIALAIQVYIPLTVIADQIAESLCNVLTPLPGGPAILSSIYGLIPASLLSTLGLPTSLCSQTGGGVFVNALLFAQNEVPSKITLLHVSSSVSAYSGSSTDGFGEVYAMFDFNFTGPNTYFLEAASSTGNPTTVAGGKMSPLITGINLTQGLIPTLAIIGKNLNVDLWAVADLNSADGTQAYNIPGLHYIEYNVNTTYFLNTPEAPIPISATGTLIGLLDQLVGDNTINEVLGLLGGLTSGNLASLFGGLTGLTGADAAGAALCSAVPLLCPAGGLTANAVTATSTSALASTITSVVNGITSIIIGDVTSILPTAPATTTSTGSESGAAPTSTSSSAPNIVGSLAGGLGLPTRRSEPTPLPGSQEQNRQKWEMIKYLVGAREQGLF